MCIKVLSVQDFFRVKSVISSHNEVISIIFFLLTSHPRSAMMYLWLQLCHYHLMFGNLLHWFGHMEVTETHGLRPTAIYQFPGSTILESQLLPAGTWVAKYINAFVVITAHSAATWNAGFSADMLAPLFFSMMMASPLPEASQWGMFAVHPAVGESMN